MYGRQWGGGQQDGWQRGAPGYGGYPAPRMDGPGRMDSLSPRMGQDSRFGGHLPGASSWSQRGADLGGKRPLGVQDQPPPPKRLRSGPVDAPPQTQQQLTLLITNPEVRDLRLVLQEQMRVLLEGAAARGQDVPEAGLELSRLKEVFKRKFERDLDLKKLNMTKLSEVVTTCAGDVVTLLHGKSMTMMPIKGLLYGLDPRVLKKIREEAKLNPPPQADASGDVAMATGEERDEPATAAGEEAKAARAVAEATGEEAAAKPGPVAAAAAAVSEPANTRSKTLKTLGRLLRRKLLATRVKLYMDAMRQVKFGRILDKTTNRCEFSQAGQGCFSAVSPLC